MKKYPVTLLQIGILSGTRAVAGAGLALALSKFVPREMRGPIGWTLLGVGSSIYVSMVVDLVLRDRPPKA